MTAIERIDQIEARANVVTETAPGVLVSEEASLIDRDVPWLIEQVRKRDAALLAVLELHKITERCGDDQCSCRRGYCNGCGDLHPCPTVRAIEEALS